MLMVNWDNSAKTAPPPRERAVDVASNRVRRLQHELKQAQQDLRRAAYYQASNNPQVAKSYDAI